MRDRYAVAEQARLRREIQGVASGLAGHRVAPPRATMTREQFETWARMFAGSTVRDLRHLRDVPRAFIQLPIVHPIVPELAQPVRRAG